MRGSLGRPGAIACIAGGQGHPCLYGTARFYPRQTGTLVSVEVCGLPHSTSGFFGLHIHEGRACAGEDFSETGSHYDPKKQPHPSHAGDLPPLLSCSGRAVLIVLTDRFRVSDVIGRTLVIHSDPDDFHSQPAGNAGKKIACGMIAPA